MKENKSFEEAMQELETVVRKLESGQVTLDDSLDSYEQGIKLIKYCNGLLDNAEKRIKILARDENGEVIEKDFETQ